MRTQKLTGTAELAEKSIMRGSNEKHLVGRRRGGRTALAALIVVCISLHPVSAIAQGASRTRSPARPVGERVDRSMQHVRSGIRRDVATSRGEARPLQSRGGPEYGAEVKRSFERTFRVSPRPRISVRNEYGDMRIRPWDRDEVRMRVEVTARAREVPRAKQLAQDTAPDVQASRDQITIGTRYPDTGRSGPVLLQSNYDIDVPVKSDLHLENRFGDIEVTGIEGRVESVCSHGETRLRELTGDLDVVSENGGVSAKRIMGDVRVDSQFGRVDLHGVHGRTTVRSKYGPVIVRSASNENSLDISCDSEDIRLILPRDADPNIYVRTTLGKIYSEIPVEVRTVGNSSTARRASASPQQIDLSGSMGTVAITFAERAGAGTEHVNGVHALKRDEINLEPGGTVKIENERGGVRVAGWNRNALGVAGTSTERAVEEQLTPDGYNTADKIAVKVEQMPDGAQTAYISPGGPSGADLDIKVPEKTDLEITNAFGDVVIDSVTGKLVVSTEGGNVKVLNLKPLRHECSLETVDGNISILIPPGSDVEIVAIAEDGSIDSAIPLEGQVGRRSSSVRGKIGEGTTRVELRVKHGRIVIN